jgi:hypothetical protein
MIHASVSTSTKNQNSAIFESNSPEITPPSSNPSNPSLAALWAKKYFSNVSASEDRERLRNSPSLSDITSKEGRANTAKQLIKGLTLASAQAWSMTENLLSEEIEHHGINPDLIDPWQIAADSHALFKKAMEAYAERVTPRRLAVIVGGEFGQVRKKYTAADPRVIGFVSMQFHYTGKVLLDRLSTVEQSLINPYFKVMDDHLYMPLRDAYQAAAQHSYGSPGLVAVQHLLPISTKIAEAVSQQICRSHPGYQSNSGLLTSTLVKISSIRDIEMFQVYLCLCVLENNMRSVQEELFPLCIMLYPHLGVSWKLIQDMLQTLSWEMHDQLKAEHLAVFLPYVHALTEMFSNDIFQG